MNKEFLEIVGNEKPTGSVKGNNCSLDTMAISVEKLIQPNPSPNSFMQKDGTEASKTRSPRGRSPSGRMLRGNPLSAVTQVRSHGTTSDSLEARTQQASQIVDADKAWSSQEWKFDELMDDRTGKATAAIFIIGNDETENCQGERSSEEETYTIFDECYRKRRRTFCDMENVHVCNHGISSIHVEPFLSQFAFHQKY